MPRFSPAILILLVILSLLAGCSTRPLERAGWAAAQGGISTDQLALERARAAIERVWPEARGDHRDIRVHVLASPAVAGYAWPSGDIYLTEGLVELCDEAELCAAVAHEIGHLMADGHVDHPLALRGIGERMEQESEADIAGCRLLADVEVSPDAMDRMLHKVCLADPTCRAALRKRIALLEQVYGPTADAD